MAKYEVTVGAEKLNPKKKRVLLKVIISLLFGILLGGATVYYYYNYYLDNKPNKNTKIVKTKCKEKEQAKNVKLDINNYTVKKLMNGIHFNDGSVTQKTLYLEEKTNAKDLDSNYLDNLLIMEAYRMKNNYEDTVTIKDLELARLNLFGNNYEVIIPTDKEVGTCPIFNYDVSNRIYSKSDTRCEFTSDIEIKYETVEAVMTEKDSITITEVVAFISDDKVYKNIDGSNNLKDEIEVDNANSFKLKDYEKDLNKYKYNFKYDKDTDNYVFESVELVK